MPSRHADIWSAARNHEVFSSAQGLTVTYGELEIIGMQDNPADGDAGSAGAHRVPQAGLPRVHPRQVEAVEPKVREFVVERIEKLRANGGGRHRRRTVQTAAVHGGGALPRRVPEQDQGKFDGWTDAIVAANTTEGGVGGPWAPIGDALGEMMAYFTALVERRRTEPEDDTISHLVSAGMGADGDLAGLMSILAFTFTMVTGGNDTTTGMLAAQYNCCTSARTSAARLIEDPELITDAIEEFLRLTSPGAGPARTTTRDVTVEGTTIPRAGRRCCSTVRATATNGSTDPTPANSM